MSLCPCGSDKNYEDCCFVLHKGVQKAPTAASLMRSRYSAFAKGEIDYIINTFHADTRAEVNRIEIEKWSQESDWKGLEIVDTLEGQESDTQGVVEFKARYEADGKKVVHHERSRFERIDDQWYFVDGEIIHDSITRDAPKVGRNEPCPCGSGKKFKKCCLV